MADKKSKKKNKKTEVPDTGDMKNRTDMLNNAQIDEVPKNPPRVGDPEYQPPIRL
ncbi:MAG: hypothetical protein II953_04460 [Clostridia bacterium]|nr:hypothetical protein [Clostridia bacterium]MBQ3860277.1 hypothetical protein [Clostridia bacterium]MBQ3956588.1 hypothetical protein [Clostridia bacterium]MBQ5355351.1 hypothetical protein [Clostridia bacterium]